MQSQIELPSARRFVRELLRQTRGEKTASISLISTYASCSMELCEKFATELGIQITNGEIRLLRESRLEIARAEARRGFPLEASRFLEWRDFERFAESCMEEMSFETQSDVRVKMNGKRWQIDVIGVKGELLVCVDCKHWAPPMSPSRFKDPKARQAEATRLYAERLAKENKTRVTSLPVILTIFETHQESPAEVVIVDVQRFPSMLRDLTPYSPNMPFLINETEDGENPIRDSEKPSPK